MARVGITADLQFAEYSNLSTLHPSGVTTRLTEFIVCFKWIVNQCVERGCTKLIIIGDVFDDRVSIPLPVLHLVCEAVAWASGKLEIVFVIGNHDSALRNPSINSLQVFSGTATVHSEPVVDGEFAFVPWTDDTDTFGKWIKKVARSKAEYLFTHALIEGAVPAAKGMHPSILCPSEFTMVWLGDVHEPTALNPNIQYAGAPLQINFGDAGGDRGFWVMDTDEDWTEFIENDISKRFHILAHKKDALAVGDGDYVRIKSDDPQVSEQLSAMLAKTTDWIEGMAVDIEEVKPRLDVRSNDSHADVLRRYCEYQEVDDVDGLVSVGMDILETARV